MNKWSVFADQRTIIRDAEFAAARNALLDNLTFVMDTTHSAQDQEMNQAANRTYYDVISQDQPNPFQDTVGGVLYTLQVTG